jgi:hypothetical protein
MATQYPVVGATALAPRRDVTMERDAGAARDTAPDDTAPYDTVQRIAVEPRRGTAAPQQQRGPAAPRLQVAPPAPVSAPRAPFVALVLALVVAGVVGILVLNTKIVENAFTLHNLQEQQSALDLQQQGLERDLAFKESPGQLAAAATRLGLVPSRTPAFIVLPDGRKLGVPQPGSSGARR